MKISTTILAAALAVTWLAAPRPVASTEQDAHQADPLRQILEEVRALRNQIERLNLRLTRLEQSVGILPPDDQPSTVEESIKAGAILPAITPPKKRMMGRPEMGLYVFPELDAPPLSPLDALRDGARWER